jgi:hypothetical protein
VTLAPFEPKDYLVGSDHIEPVEGRLFLHDGLGSGQFNGWGNGDDNYASKDGDGKSDPDRQMSYDACGIGADMYLLEDGAAEGACYGYGEPPILAAVADDVRSDIINALVGMEAP